MSTKAKIVYTKTDEAPALATRSFLPIVKAFTKSSEIEIEVKDISLASRILSNFAEYLNEDQRVEDALAILGDLAKQPEANIIKLPNISASVSQLTAAIEELQALGYALPNYPEEVITAEDKKVLALYNKVKGSAVNPVLREGNSDRRAPKAIKNYARKNPHSMGEWKSDSKTHVATMDTDDFAHNEKSITVSNATKVSIKHIAEDGSKTILKDAVSLLDGEIIDATVMRKKALISFLETQVEDAKEQGVLLSLHMKATMMKVSDPIIFGHAVKVFYKDLFEKHQETFEKIGVNANVGFANILSNLDEVSKEKKEEILIDIAAIYENRPALAMVNSDKGITNLHIPSDVIIDASMPAMIRTSGRMWNAKGELQDTKAVIPDSSYAGIYAATIDFCKKHGAFDPTTMGTVPNVGLMAQKAEEYGSHPTTFEIPFVGTVQMIAANGDILHTHGVEKGDIWRAASTRKAPIENWVQLAIERQKNRRMFRDFLA
jgi:isocitrate dehydrogenase